MSRSARVRSIDALQLYAAALGSFGDEATTALAELEMEVHRAVQWIRHDQKEYWDQQIRLAEAEVAEARINLERRRMFRVGDRPPSCDEEKAALEAAQRKLRIAQQKREAVRRWGQQLERELTDYRGGIAPLSAWLQTELPKGLALLKRLGRALESYVHAESAVEAGLPADAGASIDTDAAGSLGKLSPSSPPREPRHEDAPRSTVAEDAPATSQEPGRCARGT